MHDENFDSFEMECQLLKWAGEQLGFSECFTYEEQIDGVHRISKSVTTIGLLKSDDRTSAVWHSDLPNDALPTGIAKAYDDAVYADAIFNGDKFFLARVGTTITAFDLEKVGRLRRFQDSLDLHTDLPKIEMRVACDVRVLVMCSGWVRMAISGLHGENYDEEERAALSNRLASSQPFFEFKAPLSVDWSAIVAPADDTFQQLTELLLQKEESITEVISIGKSRASDRGRDLHVIEKLHGLFGDSETKWLFKVAQSRDGGWTDRVREHDYDGYWLITNNDITPSLFDQFKDASRNTGIKTRIWQRADFHRKLNVYSELLHSAEYFHQP